jgi:hypothetical protein
MHVNRRRTAKILLAGGIPAAGVLVAGTAIAATSGNGSGNASGTPSAYTVTQIASGASLSHTYTPSGSTGTKSEHLTQPDDITILGGHLFAGFQNGVGAQGEPSADGNTDSTIVEFTLGGTPVRQWDVRGKCDGLGADPAHNQVIATVNEDHNSSLYAIGPDAQPAAQVQHYTYNEPLPHNGGTDAISAYRGRLLISASAPGTTGPAAPNPAYPAVYAVTLDRGSHVAAVDPLFSDEASATVANTGTAQSGKTVKLGLTDPDSNTVVPPESPRFAGDFELTSQGDLQQIYVQDAGGPQQHLSVLNLPQSVDDTAWVTHTAGRLYATDNGGNTIDTVTGVFSPGTAFTAVTPCNANSAPSTCPAPPTYPANYLGTINLSTGKISSVPLNGPALHPQGLLFAGG